MVGGTVPRQVLAGGVLTLSDQEWKVTVPGSVFDIAINLHLLHDGQVVNAKVNASVFASNTAEGTKTVSNIPITVTVVVTNGHAEDATATFHPSDLNFTPVKGTVGFEMAEASMAVDIGLPEPVSFDCTPTVPGTLFVSSQVVGEANIPVATTTPASVLGATATTTTVAATALPVTGGPSPLPFVLVALGLIDLGYLVASLARPPRRARVPS